MDLKKFLNIEDISNLKKITEFHRDAISGYMDKAPKISDQEPHDVAICNVLIKKLDYLSIEDAEKSVKKGVQGEIDLNTTE